MACDSTTVWHRCSAFGCFLVPLLSGPMTVIEHNLTHVSTCISTTSDPPTSHQLLYSNSTLLNLTNRKYLTCGNCMLRAAFPANRNTKTVFSQPHFASLHGQSTIPRFLYLEHGQALLPFRKRRLFLTQDSIYLLIAQKMAHCHHFPTNGIREVSPSIGAF